MPRSQFWLKCLPVVMLAEGPPKAVSEGNLTPGASSSWAVIDGPVPGNLDGATAADIGIRLDPTNLIPRPTLTVQTHDATRQVVRIPVAFTVLSPPPTKSPSSALAGFWLMNQMDTAITRDQSGMGLHLTAISNTTLDVTGKFASTLRMDGSGPVGNRPDGKRPIRGRIDHVRIDDRRLNAEKMSALARDAGHALDGTLRGDWQNWHFAPVADSDVANDSSDPDADELTNLMEYALEKHPLHPDRAPWNSETHANRTRIRFPRVADPAISSEVQEGFHLRGLSTILQREGAENTSGIVEVPDTEGICHSETRVLRRNGSVP